MGLVLRLLGFFGSSVLRALLLLAALFLAHLLLSRALPELQRTLKAIERRPVIEQELSTLTESLTSDELTVRELERRLGEQSRSAMLELSQRLGDWEARLDDLQTQRALLLEQIEDLERERDEACASYNPLQWWVCRRLRERFGELSDRLTPLIDRLQADATAAQSSIEGLRSELAVLKDPNLDDGEKLRRLGIDDDAGRLQLAVTRKRLEEVRRAAEALERELDRTATLERSPLGFLLREWRSVRWTLLSIVMIILAAPYLQRLLSYFVLMPLVERFAAPVQLTDKRHGEIHCSDSQRSLVVDLAEGQYADVRSHYARPVQGRVSGRLLYRLSAPFISYAAGLRLLTHVEGSAASDVQLTLAAPDDPNAYLMRIDLKEHPGVVIHPRNLVGIIGNLDLTTRWRIFSLHAWATWQLRYIVLSGTGALIVEGRGDVIATTPGTTLTTKIEQPLVLGFDTRLDYACGRTEIFWPYLLGKTGLVDDVFRGPGVFLWQKSKQREHGNPVVRTFDALFSALGKLLGF